LGSPFSERARGSTNRERERSSVEIVNFPLLKHPMNWVIVLLMVMIFGIAAHLVLDFYNLNPAK
jgi:hypothetical protein